MNQKLKQRLVGAVVLVALAVIFVPMLLTGPVPGEVSDIPIEIPPRPEVAAPERAVEASPQPELAMSDSRPLAVEPADPPQAAAPGEPVAAAPAPQPAPEPRPEPAPEPKPQPAPKPESKPAAQVENPSPELGSWVVQVGSFADKGRAFALRDQLRKKRYQAFVDTTRSGASTLYRVRVGPMGTRAEAQALEAKLTKAESLEAQVRPHP